MSDDAKWFRLGDLRGGRNGSDPPLSLQQGQCVEALNVDWFNATFARKRNGASTQATTFSAGGPFTGTISALFAHVPAADQTLRELWAIDDTFVVGRMAGAATFAAPTVDDAFTATAWNINAVSFNNKLFLAGKTAQDRLHCWDPTDAVPRVRRTGLATPAAATAADTGGGTYAAILRYYRVFWTTQSGGVTLRRSDVSASVTFTPSGGGAAARVTRPTAPGEGETHWELYASLDDVSYFLVTTTVIATTTADDSTVTTNYLNGSAMPSSGLNANWTSVAYLVVDGQRLLGAGTNTSGSLTSRIYFSAIVGATNVGDDERVTNTVTQKNFLDLDEKDGGGGITALGRAVNGAPMAWKYDQTWKLQPTYSPTAPYAQICLSKTIGCVHQKTVVQAIDAVGNPAIYWLSARGPYRLASNGLEYLGRDVEDIWATVNLGATTIVGHGVYLQDLHQIWWWIAVGSENEPQTTKLCFDVYLGTFTDEFGVRKGWAKHTGVSAAARCSVMMSNTLGATMSRDLVPYIGRNGAANSLGKLNTATTSDFATAFQSYVLTAPSAPAGLGNNAKTEPPSLMATTAAGVTISCDVIPDFDTSRKKNSTASLTAVNSESRKQVKFEQADLGGFGVVQYQIGDAAAVAAAWTLDAFAAPVQSEGPR